MTAEIKQHTIRIPLSLFERLEMRAVLMRRSVNQEITTLIQAALDAQADADAKVLANTTDRDVD